MAKKKKNNEEEEAPQGPTGVAQSFVSKGLFIDYTDSNQPPGTYKWALNAINESISGEMGSLINEPGNFGCAEFSDDNYVVIGSVYIKDDDFVIFMAPTDPYLFGYGKIVRLTNCVAKTLIYSSCLNFKVTKQVQAIQRTRNGCEVNLYFTDFFNDIRHININSLRDYVIEGISQDVIDAGTDPGIWDCEKMKLWPDYSLPCIQFDSITEGGNLPAGVYQFAVQYLDSDFNATNWTPLTQPVPVYEDPTTNTELRIKGSAPLDKTGKSIRLRITSIDESFSYVRVAIVPSISGTGKNSGIAYLMDAIPLYTSEDRIVEVTTIGTEDEVSVPVAEITIPRKIYQKAKTLAQIKSRLVLGNVSENEIDHAKFQRAAQDIQIRYTTRTVSTEDATKDSVQSGKYYFDYRSYMRDEVVALAVVWIFKDGTESVAYHIPGRRKDTASDGTPFISVGDYHNPNLIGYVNVGNAEHNREQALNGWDSTVIVTNANYANTRNINVHHYLNNTVDGNGDIERWEVYNTAVRTQHYNVDQGYLTKGEMGYYECRSDRYPGSRDCKGIPVYPYSKKIDPAITILVTSTPLQDLINITWDSLHNGTGDGFYTDPVSGVYTACYTMDKVRHHRMPDTTLEPHQYGDRGITNGLINEFCGGPFPAANPKAVSLGIEALNVMPPQEYAHLIQGFRIVKAKQEIKDKTVLDKGIVYYNHFAYKQYHGKNLNAGPYFSGCAWMQQGNYFNKHITGFACVHGGWNNAKIAQFGETPDNAIAPFNDHGQVSLAADNVYDISYNSNRDVASGFVASYGLGNGVGDSEDETDRCLNCSNPVDEPFDSDGATFNAFTNMLVQNNKWYEWFTQPGVPGTYANHPRVASDYPEFGNGYPNAAWGWFKPQHPNDDCGVEVSNQGVNLGYDTQIRVFPNASMSYHGPLSKFGKIEGAEFMKVERVLIGYTWNILCNNACCHDDGLEGTHKQSGDNYAKELTGNVDSQTPDNIPGNTNHHNDNDGKSGIGSRIAGRDDNGTTYIYSRVSYQHSVVPYSQISDGVTSLYTLTSIMDPTAFSCVAAGGNDSLPKHAWDDIRYPIYGYPLSNVRIDDYIKINAFEKVFIESFGDVPFDNNTAMECLPMSFKSKRYAATVYGNQDQYTEWIRIPYPGNNPGFNKHFAVSGTHVNNPWGAANRDQCPLDTSLSLANCDRLEDATSGEFCLDADENATKRGRVTAYYVSIKKNAYNAYGNISGLIYNPTHNCIIPVDSTNPAFSVNSGQLFGGGSFVSRFAFKHTQYNARCGRNVVNGETGEEGDADVKCTEKKRFWSHMGNKLGEPAFGYGLGQNTNVVYENSCETVSLGIYSKIQKRHGIFNHLSWYWTESYINTELRTGTQKRGEWFYPYHFEGGASYGTLTFVDEANYFRSAHSGAPYEPDNTLQDYEEAQSFTMNPDYNKGNDENIYVSIPIQYDFCKDCQETHPYRIAYSEQSFQEEQKDNYKYFTTNNYRDIPAHRGVVWNIFQYRNSLFVHTEESLWRVEPARNIIPTDTSTVYIGTGDFFSEEIQELVEGDTGFLGSRSQWAMLINAAGVSWVDEKQRKIFTLEQSPKDLSAMGVKSWTQNNMNLEIYDQYEDIYGVPFPLVDNPANPAGAGYLSAYDGKYNRMLFTKRDYMLRAPFTTKDPNSPYYQVLSIGNDSGLWEFHALGEDCQCIEDLNLRALSPSTYAVTSIIGEDGTKICRHTYTIEERRSLERTADIWVFYDLSSASAAVAKAANAEIISIIADEKLPGGQLEGWEGKEFHIPISGDGEWLQYLQIPMGDTTAVADVITPGFPFTVKDPGYYDKAYGSYISPNAICIVIQDNASGEYHSAINVAHSAPTADYKADFQAFTLSHQLYTAGGRTFKAFVYPNSLDQAVEGITQGTKQFIKHLVAAVEGDRTIGTRVSKLTGQPDLPGNAAQVGVPNKDVIDISYLGTTNTYDETELTGWLGARLTDYGISSKYDKRSADSFINTSFANDIQGFFIEAEATRVINYVVDRPCTYNLLGTGNICPSCGKEGALVQIPLNDGTLWEGLVSDVFECKGWTLSYSVMANAWVSWHSYIPNFYMSSKNYFISGINALPGVDKVWKHGLTKAHDNYQTFYGCVYPHIVDMITTDNPLTTTLYDSVRFITDASHYNPQTGQYVDDRYITFDSGYLYNSYQITDMLNFKVKDTNVQTMTVESIAENFNSCLLERKERIWSMNGYRDMAIDRTTINPPSMFTTDWANLAQDYYIDKKVNPAAVSQTKNWFEQARMRDRYLGIRLFFSNLAASGKHKLVTNFLYGITTQSPR